ncbi:MAG: exodeoxyribonuclease VII small subunit [Bacillota bacterium]
MAKKTGKTSFEKAMRELEDIVARLEEGQLDLDESMALYEKGMELSKQCMKMLETAQERVRMLVCTEEKTQEIPFTMDEELGNGLS